MDTLNASFNSITSASSNSHFVLNPVLVAVTGGFLMLVMCAIYFSSGSKESTHTKNESIDTRQNTQPNQSDQSVESDTKSNQNSDEFILIGVTGRKRSGKDTVGKYLIDNYDFVRVAYADALKEACKIVFGFSDAQVYGDDLKEVVDEYWGHSPREVLQKVGTELFREELPRVCKNISNDIWIRSVERQIRNLQKQGHTRFVITDVRFPNELDFISKMKGVSWKVSRPSLLQNLDPKIPVHASEAMIDDFKCDHEFVNDGTLEQLFDSVEDKIVSILDHSPSEDEESDGEVSL
ncbi:monophosphate kinase [Yasminevirus sp. GU-2018]|uniref:Monophosphate kinase n=1 Tax=Yasminevirus sp. GU-2018 TaxID=2420051 RepID=A0A5K0U7E1_9VIRU|nr:monophosphate kinase [Yasminevirus sp. GU-2018]